MGKINRIANMLEEMILVLFPSKRDPWLGIIFFGIMGTGFVSTFISQSHLAIKVIMFFAVLFVFSLWFGTSYNVEAETIKVKSGPFTTIVPIKEIRQIRKTKSIQSAPALSLDRMIIEWGEHNTVVVSPSLKSDFIRLLKEKNKKIKIDKQLY